MQKAEILTLTILLNPTSIVGDLTGIEVSIIRISNYKVT